MKFEKIFLEVEKYDSLDIIATSFEEPTQAPTEDIIKHDPYKSDKW